MGAYLSRPVNQRPIVKETKTFQTQTQPEMIIPSIIPSTQIKERRIAQTQNKLKIVKTEIFRPQIKSQGTQSQLLPPPPIPSIMNIFSKQEAQKSVLFITTDQYKKKIIMTKQGIELLMKIPAGRDIALLMNYGSKKVIIKRVFKDKLINIQLKKQSTQIYLQKIGHCGNLTALMLQWKGQFNSHIFSVLLSISSLLLFSDSHDFYHKIENLADIIPISCTTIERLKEYNPANSLPPFMWFQKQAGLSFFKPQQLDYCKDKYSAKKRNFDREIFRQIYHQICFQEYEQIQFSGLYCQPKDPVKAFDLRKRYAEMRLDILKHLRPRTLNGFKVSPEVALAFIMLSDGSNELNYGQAIKIKDELPKQVSLVIRNKVYLLICEEKTRRGKVDSKDKKREIIENLKATILPIITEVKNNLFISPAPIIDFIENELKTFGLSICDLQKEQQDTREREFKSTKNRLDICFDIISKKINQRIQQSKQSIFQILFEERKWLQSQSKNFSQTDQMTYLEQIRDFFDQKINQEIRRLEMENAAKSQLNAVLQAENKEIKAKVDFMQNKQSVCSYSEDNYSEFELMNRQEQTNTL